MWPILLEFHFVAENLADITNNLLNLTIVLEIRYCNAQDMANDLDTR